MYLVGLHTYYKMIHGPYNVKSPVIFGGFTAPDVDSASRVGSKRGMRISQRFDGYYECICKPLKPTQHMLPMVFTQ